MEFLQHNAITASNEQVCQLMVPIPTRPAQRIVGSCEELDRFTSACTTTCASCHLTLCSRQCRSPSLTKDRMRCKLPIACGIQCRDAYIHSNTSASRR